MKKISRTISADESGHWSWTLGHDANGSQDRRSGDELYPLVIFPSSVGPTTATYKNVPGDRSLADLIMQKVSISDFILKLERMNFFSERGSNFASLEKSRSVDSSTLNRVRHHLVSLTETEYSEVQSSYDSICSYLDFHFGNSPVIEMGEDCTVGLGRIIKSAHSDELIVLCPPSGISSSPYPHRARVIGEVLIYGTLYKLGGKDAHANHCAEAFKALKKIGWIDASLMSSVILAILDHGRRRQRGENVPPKTVQAVISIASAYAEQGFNAFERLLND